MMKTRPSRISRAARIAAGSLLALATLGSSAASTLAARGGSGSIWTTSQSCAAAATQDVNLYATGDTVYLRGKNFAGGADFSWTIAGLPGGASGDPATTVASGNGTTDASGAFCVAAYVVAADDWGEYKADVDQGSTSKQDNYHVNRPDDTTGGTTDPGTGTTDPGTGTTDPGTGTTDPGTGTTDPGTGTTDPGTGTTDPGSGTPDSGTTDPGTTTDKGTTTDPVTTDPGAGSTDNSSTTDPGNDSTDPGSVSTPPTQQVLGITDTVTQQSSIALPPTDTIGGASDRTFPSLLIAGLAAVAGAAILLAPSRRRNADR